ncbi:hypothetical protein [Acetobacter orleanensis]|uniref:hypothetical protein n=1 Tax=Acetobacter orleanensis TaxID=104099 RepID=UPI000A94B77E|nr:hypothetical protein [Acetobacter orleanensis]
MIGLPEVRLLPCASYSTAASAAQHGKSAQDTPPLASRGQPAALLRFILILENRVQHSRSRGCG